ncbi:MAG: hypothetical protein E6Q89_10020 [Bacteroidia bacterium]|nr:MAG: hypothetical protein E6Q89_10020 [Bacteroidia bacterium]
MNAIGGYFGIECDLKENYPFKGYHHLNTARNAIEVALKTINPKKVYLPYFTCDVVLEPINRLKIPYEFYDIRFDFEPNINIDKIRKKDCFILNNYFGITTKLVNQFKKHKIKNLIIDNAQALFAKPVEEAYNIYSPRKFMGLPDGGLIYSNSELGLPNDQDQSYERCSHLLKRIDLSAEEAYSDFQFNDKSLENQAAKKMSKLTQYQLKGVDFETMRKRRIENFNFIAQALNEENKIKVEQLISEEDIPMVYPYYTEDAEFLRKKLTQNKIYCAQYWPNVFNWSNEKLTSFQLTKNIIAIPIDQRYSINEMKTIIACIKS